MKMTPAMTPHRIDCGLRNTTPMPVTAVFNQSLRRTTACGAGSSTRRRALITSPAIPIPTQKLLHDTPDAITGPTTNRPAEPPAIPNIYVAPMSVDARDAGKCVHAIYEAT